MFYCDPCRLKQDPVWPEGWMKSQGPCEICGKSALCSDVPSKYLPLPRRRTS